MLVQETENVPLTGRALDLVGPNWRLPGRNCSACDGDYLSDGHGRRNVSPL
jgi:hypothetical protein